MLQLKKPLAFIDIEATGANVSVDRIVEIAIVKLLPDGNRTIKRKILNPQVPITKTISDIHGRKRFSPEAFAGVYLHGKSSS